MGAVVRVTSGAARSARERALLAQIDVHGPMAAYEPPMAVDSSIVVEASYPGLATASVSIPVSTNVLADGVMAAASAAAGKPVDFFGKTGNDDFAMLGGAALEYV